MNEELTDYIREFSQDSTDRKKRLNSINDDEQIALILESFPIDDRREVWADIEPERRLRVLLCLRQDPRETILDNLSLNELDALFDGMYADQLIDLAESLPKRLIERALKRMDEEQIKFYEQAREYADAEVGHWVNRKLLTLPANSKVRDAMRLLRRETPKYTEAVFLVDRIGQYLGSVPISGLLSTPEHISLTDLIDVEYPTIAADEDIFKASRKIQTCGYSALPVMDINRKLIGRLDMLTANEVIMERYESHLMAGTGLNEEEDLFAPVRKSIRGRSIWLGINLLTALLASWFIGLFEHTLEQVVALAVLMPVVASMGGIAGSQTLALIIRGLALGQVNNTNAKVLLDKELRVGAVNGLLWAIIIAAVTALWFDNAMIGLVIALAILANLIAAAASGLLIPLGLTKFGFDPALSGAVILTTVTDIVGFVVFLGLGTILLL